jgi:hypothetical protein
MYNVDMTTKLYIKQCSHCEKRYFGTSVRDNVMKYRGSGIHWKRHLSLHKAKAIHVTHHDYGDDIEYASRVATRFSKMFSISTSDKWMNMKDENCKDGHPIGWIHSDQTREKIKNTLTGRKASPEAKKKLSDLWQEKVKNGTHHRLGKSSWLAGVKGEDHPRHGLMPANALQKGHTLWVGRKHKEETIEKLRKPKSPEHLAALCKPKSYLTKYKCIFDGIERTGANMVMHFKRKYPGQDWRANSVCLGKVPK